ncbi:helix-turn-helix transcriptional regulator [Paenibacillus sp. 19GGS1-52]|uniref:helix-turn-helix domain-containing protein n=1 Tax=Paenibacillus sp. 19GGS1-52 TaxID=2758563 RepID=UPI001EFA3739|nr:helix-turn-helix transcriptional regulator [Paenibacillus sp. 19GGS1-52]
MKHCMDGFGIIQDGLSNKVQLSIFITNIDGECIIPPTIIDPITDHVTQHYEIKEYMKRTILTYGASKSPRVIEGQSTAFFGTKLMLYPVTLADYPDYYIWSGFFTEEAVTVDVNDRPFKVYGEMIQKSPDEVRQVIHYFDMYSSLLTTILTSQMEVEKREKHLGQLNQILGDMHTQRNAQAEFLESLHDFLPEVDFLAYAIKNKDDSFQILYTSGKQSEALREHKFLPGEGILGKVAATSKCEIWRHTDKDPRNDFFKKLNLPIKQLFCYPIFNESAVDGVYFGGMYSYLPELQSQPFIKISADLLQLHLSNTRLRAEHSEMNALMTIVFELFKSIKETNQVKQLFYLLLDATLNITETTLVCLLYRDKFRTGKLHFLSRGIQQPELHDVTSKLISKYFDEEVTSTGEEQVCHWEQGRAVLEVPIMYNNSLVSVLCVEVMRDKYGLASYYADAFRLLYTLLIQKLMINELEELARIKLLQSALQQWNPELFKELQVLEKDLSDILPQLPLTEDEQHQALLICPILFYDTEILISHSFAKDTIGIIEEFQIWNKGGAIPVSIVGQVLALTYIQQKDDESQTDSKSGYSNALIHAFDKYNQKAIFLEADFSIKEKEDEAANHKVKENMEQLSKRENEVLRLVAKGYGNREIAMKLFISEHTVKNHISSIFQKLDIKDRNKATAALYKQIYGIQ